MGHTAVVPLGGLGEIGLNAVAFESNDSVILVDCGLLFPRDQYPGADYVVPDFSYLRDRRAKIRGVLLTHGHEDHTGAVAHLVQNIPVPVYGTPVTLGLLECRLGEQGREIRDLFRAVAPGSTVELGPFRVEFMRVTHSTPQACALGIETPGGTVLYTGDFKFDSTPVDAKATDEAALARWGQRGVDLLCCDSTNSLQPGDTPSEREVGRTLRRLIPGIHGRAYVALFPSNIHRVQQVIEVSRSVGRRVTLLGRSTTQTVRLARRLGELKTAPGDVIPEHRSRGYPRDAVTVILGGSQAEPGSALWRVVNGREPHHRILPGDHVLLSARLIPGNEAAIYRLINRCIEHGATVHYGASPAIHVSGHPSAGDVARMAELTRPRNVMPVHGELRHLQALGALFRALGVPADRTFILRNGQTLRIEDGAVAHGPPVTTGRVFVDLGETGDVGDSLLADRRILARAGVAMAIAAFPAGDPGSMAGMKVMLRGVVPEGRVAAVAAEAEQAVARHVGRLGTAPLGAEKLEEEMMRALRRYFRRRGGRYPLVVAAAVRV